MLSLTVKFFENSKTEADMNFPTLPRVHHFVVCLQHSAQAVLQSVQIITVWDTYCQCGSCDLELCLWFAYGTYKYPIQKKNS